MDKKDMLKDYVTVNERVQQFWELYPNGKIISEIVSDLDGQVVFKTSIFKNQNDSTPCSTGHAMEKEGSSYINKGNHMENCETSSVGRALAFMGLKISKAIASREELENAVEHQDKLKMESHQEIPANIKIKYQVGKGSLDGLEEWVNKE